MDDAVAAVSSSPGIRLATASRKVLSSPPENATIRDPSSLSRDAKIDFFDSKMLISILEKLLPGKKAFLLEKISNNQIK